MESNIQLLIKLFLFSMMIRMATNEDTYTPVSNGLWTEVVEHKQESICKITIVGCGGVGAGVAFSLMTQMVGDEIVLIGRDDKKVQGEVKDLQDGSGFVKSPKIIGGTDYALAKNSKVCIITSGVGRNAQEPGQQMMSRNELVQKNLEIYEEIIPKLVENCPDAVFIIVTNPVDIMTYITWKLVGKKNTYKIIGSGTNLDSQRMRVLIAKDLHISPESVNGWVIGEHGDSSITAWSGVNVAGVKLRGIKSLSKDLENPDEPYEKDEDWFSRIHKKMMNSAYEVVQAKGKTTWAVSLSVTNIVYSILHNVPNVHAVSTLVKGYHSIDEEVFMSLPCVLGETGITHIIKQNLDKDEKKKLKETGKKMSDIIKTLKWKNE